MPAPAPRVYQPLRGSPRTLGERLEKMLAEGRRVTSQERFRRQRNREAYRGNTYLQPLSISRGSEDTHLHRLAPSELLPSGRRRDSNNRLRQMIDGRVSMLTGQKPPHKAVPKSAKPEDVDGARLATRFIDYHWDNPDGWDVASFGRKLGLYGEQDGVTFANVVYDRSAGPVVTEMVVPDENTPEGVRPVTDVGEATALRNQDPEGKVLWQERPYPAGEVRLRVVRAGSLGFDPNMTTDWRDCGWVIESRRRKIVDLEREVGRPLDDLIRRSDATMGRRTRRRTGGRIESEEGDTERSIDVQYEVLVHELFHKPTGPTGEFPDGAHIMWAQDASGEPFVEEQWLWPDGTPRDLPYYPYTPRPDGGHLLRTQGTVDELLPLQRQMDLRFSQYGDWLDIASRPPLVMVGGTLRSKAVYNQDRVVYTNPGFERPFFLQVPPDPGQALLQVLQYLDEQMSEIAVQSGPVRGQNPPPGVTAAAAIHGLIQQGESQLVGTEAEWRTVMEWAVGEGLRNVSHFYSIGRQLHMPGVDDQAEFHHFTQESISGATRWRITGSVLPKNKQAQTQMLIQIMQFAQDRFDPSPYIAELLESDVDTIVTRERMQTRKQERENLQIASLGQHPERDRIWETFTAMRDAYVGAMTQLSNQMQEQALESGEPPTVGPQQIMRLFGPGPPKVLDLLRGTGWPVPKVSVTDRHHLHLSSLEMWMTDAAMDSYHPIVQQAALEHLNEHVEAVSQGVQSMAAQNPQMPGTPGAQPPEAPAPADEPER